MRHLAPLQAVVAAVTVASVVIIVNFSPQASTPAALLGWGRDAFGLYDRRAPPQYMPANGYSSGMGTHTGFAERGGVMRGAFRGAMDAQQRLMRPGEGEREFIARARQVPAGWAERDIQKWSQPGSQTGLTTLRNPHDNAHHQAQHHAQLPHRPYSNWEGEKPWMKFQDYKELSAIQRLKYAEKRQSSIMGKILKQHTPSGARPGLGSLFTQGLPEDHPGFNPDLQQQR